MELWWIFPATLAWLAGVLLWHIGKIVQQIRRAWLISWKNGWKCFCNHGIQLLGVIGGLFLSIISFFILDDFYIVDMGFACAGFTALIFLSSMEGFSRFRAEGMPLRVKVELCLTLILVILFFSGANGLTQLWLTFLFPAGALVVILADAGIRHQKRQKRTRR